MKSKAVRFWIALLFVFTGVMIAYVALRSPRDGATQANSTIDLDAPSDATVTREPVTEFTMVDQTGSTFHSSDLDGDVWVASFFFASCPTTCLKKNFQVKEFADQFAPKGVRFVSMTIDPANDTPSVLEEYAKKFNADPKQWVFLTHSKFEYIQRVGVGYFNQMVEPSTHSEVLIAVDKWGNKRGYFMWQKPESREKLVELVAKLITEKTPPSEEDRVPVSG